jgi:hypothetical protein
LSTISCKPRSTSHGAPKGYFSKIVMAHELGHFGLCHINHSGVQNIMFSTVAGNLRLGAVQLLSAG